MKQLNNIPDTFKRYINGQKKRIEKYETRRRYIYESNEYYENDISFNECVSLEYIISCISNYIYNYESILSKYGIGELYKYANIYDL